VKILALEKIYIKKSLVQNLARISPPKIAKLFEKNFTRGPKIKIKIQSIPNYFLKTHKSFWEFKF
jgi:hypothetical protein